MFTNINTHKREVGYLETHNQNARTQRIFKLIFLENDTLNEKMLFFFFDLFLHIESLCGRSYHDFWDSPYVKQIST